MEEELLGTKIPGFFPTPAETVDQLVELAEACVRDCACWSRRRVKGDIADGIHRYMKEFYDSDAQDGVQLSLRGSHLASGRHLPRQGTSV
jgi:hypothetical protein